MKSISLVVALTVFSITAASKAEVLSGGGLLGSNTAFGDHALSMLTTGRDNSAFGSRCQIVPDEQRSWWIAISERDV
jgi:hypothetical protein